MVTAWRGRGCTFYTDRLQTIEDCVRPRRPQGDTISRIDHGSRQGSCEEAAATASDALLLLYPTNERKQATLWERLARMHGLPPPDARWLGESPTTHRGCFTTTLAQSSMARIAGRQ